MGAGKEGIIIPNGVAIDELGEKKQSRGNRRRWQKIIREIKYNHSKIYVCVKGPKIQKGLYKSEKQ